MKEIIFACPRKEAKKRRPKKGENINVAGIRPYPPVKRNLVDCKPGHVGTPAEPDWGKKVMVTFKQLDELGKECKSNESRTSSVSSTSAP